MMLFAIVIVAFAIVCPLGLLPSFLLHARSAQPSQENGRVVFNALAFNPEVVVRKGKYRVMIHRRSIALLLSKVVHSSANVLEEVVFRIKCLYYKILFKLYSRSILSNPRMQQQSEISGLQKMIADVFKDVGLNSTKLILFSNTFVTIISLSIELFKRGYKETSKYVIVPLATSIVSLAAIVISAENLSLPEIGISSIINYITGKEETIIPTNSIEDANRAIAKENMCKPIKKRMFADFRTGPEDWPVDYLKQLSFDHSWEVVAKVYKLTDDQVKMLQQRVGDSVPADLPAQTNVEEDIPMAKPHFNNPDEMAVYYARKSKFLDLKPPQTTTNRLLKWRNCSIQHLKENYTLDQMKMRYNLTTVELDFIRNYNPVPVAGVSDPKQIFDEDVKNLEHGILPKFEKQTYINRQLKIVIGIIGFALTPLLQFFMGKFSKMSGVVEMAKVVQSTKYLNEQIQSSADFLLNLFGFAPETFSIEYHIAAKSKELNAFIQTPINNLLEEPILLADYQSQIYETEAFLRKVPVDHTTLGLRGLHAAASSHLAAIKRTGQLTGFRQEPRLVLFMGPAGTGKTRLAKKLAHIVGEKLYPNIDPMRRILEITASNNYWPGISGQPIALFDECDSKMCADSLLFKNIKGLCSTAVFNCEGAAVEHKHQPAPFKILIGTTNMDIPDLRSMLHAHYGEHSMNAIWSRMLIYQVERNVRDYGEINILNREASPYDTTGNFKHSIIKECSWSEQYQSPMPTTTVNLATMLDTVCSRIQFLEEQYRKTQVVAQSTGNKLSICVTGASGVGKTEYFVKNSFSEYFSARFNLGEKNHPKIIVHDDSHQRGHFNEATYLEEYEKAPSGSVFLNIENLSSLPLTFSTIFSYLSLKIYPIYKTKLEAVPRRYGIYPARFSGILSYFVWFGRNVSWVNPHIEVSYIFILGLTVQMLGFFFPAYIQMGILLANIILEIFSIWKLKCKPISICADIVDTENLTSFFSDIYVSNIVSSSELNVINSVPPRVAPNIEVILDKVENVTDFAPTKIGRFLYQNRDNFLAASGNRIYIEPSIALKMVRYIGELKFMKLSNTQASHYKILNQFYRICKSSGICVSLAVTVDSVKYTIYGNNLYVSEEVNVNSCVTAEGILFENLFISWKDIASVQVGSATLQEVMEGKDIDYVRLKTLVMSVQNEKLNSLKSDYYEAQLNQMKQVSAALWKEFLDFFKTTITGKIIAGLVLLLAVYGIGKAFLGSDESKVKTQGKRKIGSRKSKTHYETDQERQNASCSEIDSDEDTSNSKPQEQGNKKGNKKKRVLRGFESDENTGIGSRSAMARKTLSKVSTQVKIASQAVETIPDLNGLTGIGPAQQLAQKCMKNLVHIYAIPSHIQDSTVQQLTPDEINSFSRNYAIVIKDDILVTVGHMGILSKKGFNHYIMCDELMKDKIYGKCEIIKSYKNRDLSIMRCPIIKGKFKSIYSKLTKTFKEAGTDGNVLFARYGPTSDKGVKVEEFHSAYMALFSDDTRIDCEDGTSVTISKFIYNYFGLTDTLFTFAGDCGLPYVYKHGTEYKMIGIHAMATTTPGSYISVATCVFQEDIDLALAESGLQKCEEQNNQICPGCASEKMKWVEPTKRKDVAEHSLLWNNSCGASKNNFIMFVQDIEKYCSEKFFEYSTYIGESCKGTVPGHLHVHRYTLDPMKKRKTRALETDNFSVAFDNYFHLVHFMTHQMAWAEEFRIVFSYLPSGKVYTEFFLYEFTEELAVAPKRNLQQFKFGRQVYNQNIPIVSQNIWQYTEGGEFTSNLWNITSSRITPLARVPSQGFKRFKTKYSKTPYSNFVDLPNEKRPFDPNCQEPHPNKLVSRQGRFNPFLVHLNDITPSPCMSEVQLKILAFKPLFREKFKLYRNLRPVSEDEVIYGIDKQSDLAGAMTKLEVNTSAGYSLQQNYKVILKKDILSVDEHGIYHWENNDASRDLQQSYNEAKAMIENGTPVFTIFMDTLKDEKLKIKKLYKGRQFSAADFLLVLLERKYLGQFLAKAVKYDKEVAVGMDPILDFHELFCRMAKLPFHFTVDFVSWDKKIPAAAYRLLFNLLCDINPQYSKVLSAFSEMYQNTYHVMDDVLYAVSGTMPSGCVATAPLNSILNNFLMVIAYIYLCEENGVEPSVSHFGEHIEQVSYGDDKWISTDLPWFNMITVSRIFKEKFGMDMGSSEKGEEMTEFVPLDQISFISRYPRKLPSGVYSGALKKMTIETFFHWTTCNKKEHLGILLTLASFESCLWEKQYYNKITEQIEMLIEKFKYLKPYVYIYDREVVAEAVMDMGFVRILCQLGLSEQIEINTTHRLLRYCHKQSKLSWKNNRIQGKFCKMASNTRTFENDLVWLNEWAQKHQKVLKWTHCRLQNETVVDLTISDKTDYEENSLSFQSRGSNLIIAKHNCAAVARKVLEPKFSESKFQHQTKNSSYQWDKPEMPKFKTFGARLATFDDWPISHIQSPVDLAEAGLFYVGHSDRVRCFHCGGGLEGWEATDIPKGQHATHFDRCYFVRLNAFHEYEPTTIQAMDVDSDSSLTGSYSRDLPMDIDSSSACTSSTPMDVNDEEPIITVQNKSKCDGNFETSLEISVKGKRFMHKLFQTTKHTLTLQSDVPAINVTNGNTVPIAQVTGLEPSMAAGNTFYSNTRIGTAVENLNPTALALNNPAGTGSSFDIKESVYSLYKPWISTSVNGSQAVGTEVFRLSLDPQKLPASILNYVNLHENIIPALDIGIFVNGTAGGLGSLVLGWVPDASEGKTYALEDLWRVACKAISLASTTATTEVLADIRRVGLYRKVSGDAEPFPGIIGMIDMPATNVNRNDLVNFYIRIMVKLNPQCLLMSPIVTKPSNSLSTQLYSDIPLKAFIKEPIIDLTVTGPARLEQSLYTTVYPDSGWNTGTFEPLPIIDSGRRNLIWGVASSQDTDPNAYPIFVDPTLTNSTILENLSTEVSYSGGTDKASITRGMPVYDKIYIAYGTVPTPKGIVNREIPGTKTKIDPIYAYLLNRSWLNFTCNYIYVQEGGIGVLVEFTLDGTFDSLTDKVGNKWTVFRTSKRFAQANGSRKDLVFYGNFKNFKNYNSNPLYGAIARGVTNFAIMQSSLPVSDDVKQDSTAKGSLSAWPCYNEVLDDDYGFVFYKGEQLAMINGDSNLSTPEPQTSVLILSKRTKINYFIAETTLGNQVALPGAMNALTLSKQGFTILPTNRSAGIQPPSAAGYASLTQFLESMLDHFGKPAISFGLKYGKTQVELQACYANGMIMTRGASNMQRLALPVSDCYISNIMPIADPIDIIPLATNVSSWRPIVMQVSQQMWGTAALGIGQGLSSIGSALYANSAREFNAQMLERLQELKNKGLLDLEKLKYENQLALYGYGSASAQSASRSNEVPPPAAYPGLKPQDKLIDFVRPSGTNVDAPEFIPQFIADATSPPQSQSASPAEDDDPSSSSTTSSPKEMFKKYMSKINI